MAGEPEMREAEEFDLIGAIRDRLGGATAPAAGDRHHVGIGDDAAVTEPAGATATSVDALVEGVHFRSAWCPPRAVGHKAMASALSDLAAMGAEPGEAYIWLGRPESLGVAECLEVCDGLAEVAADSGVALLGGDLTASPVLALAVTVVGHGAEPTAFVRRDGAEAGHAVCVSGELGGASAGLTLLEHPEPAAAVAAEVAAAPVDRQLRPAPRLALGRALAAAGASAMIDISDGLGADAEQLAAASRVGIEIEMSSVPLGAGVAEVAEAAGRDPFELACGGEDYELLCALPRPAVSAAVEAADQVGSRLSEVGRAVPGHGVRLRLPGGGSLPTLGHDHFRRLARGRG